ncbi:Acetyltransferase (GNAT) family protein [Paenibacillus polysaccharolyticus]|uniref:Acetyltransferase (GNAT) family protein n=1 Tax=Paenibacillus polysaccharolyticus TaxID=582692 RepID=A0A1G5BI06_9BACL|nr:GNAT family N-acetyltransferase [Paenibacillus polysaccharolyticus]SCX89781.1 Acetyltransferase (GNAT) family protein [Paenibacillus polysaccharolyticus]
MIREAEARDAATIDKLYRELLPNHAHTEVLAERIEEIRLHEHSFLFVYEVREQVVGTAHLHICLDALAGNRPFGLVERVVMSSEVQGNGYGTELMEHVEQVCLQMNASKILLASGASRQGAHQFYQKLGYDGESSKAFKKYL